MRNVVLMLILTLFFLACGGPSYNYPYAKEPDPRASEYVIGVSDRLRVTVWKNPELNSDIQVRPDGTVTMSLIGEVQADGLTPTQLRQQISEKLAAFIKEAVAVVTVAVTEVNSYRVTVTGQVEQPGVYAAKQYLTVADAIALAGGPTRFASAEETVLIRTNRKTGQIRRIPINYPGIVKGEALQHNLVLLAGDTIMIP